MAVLTPKLIRLAPPLVQVSLFGWAMPLQGQDPRTTDNMPINVSELRHPGCDASLLRSLGTMVSRADRGQDLEVRREGYDSIIILGWRSGFDRAAILAGKVFRQSIIFYRNVVCRLRACSANGGFARAHLLEMEIE